MTRNNFITKLIRIGLLAILALISVILAGRITFDKCASCPISENCKGKSSCEKLNPGKT
jgi:hypothetical protein